MATNSVQDNAQTDADLTSEQNQEVDARWKEALRRYRGRLSDEQKARIRRVLVQNERMLVPVREFAVANGDAPATTLKLVLRETSEAAPAKSHLEPSTQNAK